MSEHITPQDLAEVLETRGFDGIEQLNKRFHVFEGLFAAGRVKTVYEGLFAAGSVKTLYEGPPKCRCCTNWVEEPPTNLRDNIEEQRESKNTHFWHIKDYLAEVFEQYTGITAKLQELVFFSPFKPFYHEWDAMQKIARSITDPLKKHYVGLLHDILRSELEHTFAKIHDLKRNKVITHDYLWTIFKPGTEIYSPSRGDGGGYGRFYQLSGEPYYSMSGFEFELDGIDTDGCRFGFKKVARSIEKFEGTIPITQLDFFPAHLHPEYRTLRAAATARGRRFKEIVSAPYYYAAEMRGQRDIRIEDRIVIDTFSFFTYSSERRVSLRSLDSTTFATLNVSDQDSKHRSNHHDLAYNDDSPYGHQASPNSVGNNKQAGIDDMLHLCTDYVRGFSLRSKEWYTFNVKDIQNITWNEGVFQSLVLDNDQKRLIVAFVESHATNRNMFDDVIEGKGQGIIMLLEGPPGVGKTLTAEAIADYLHKPFYAINTSELGSSLEQVEDRLRMIFHVAATWDAVLLLDECDVFLERRTDSYSGDLCSGIVSIFLRQLEYYRGVLFMTTNRVEIIDPAFQSRIHLTIRYPDLGREARRKIWKRFIELQRGRVSDSIGVGKEGEREWKEAAGLGCVLGEGKFEEDLDELEKLDMNGREIKNLMRTAQLLAAYEKSPLGIEHIRAVLKATGVRATA